MTWTMFDPIKTAISNDLIEILKDLGINDYIPYNRLSIPPKEGMGNFAFGCFELTKTLKQKPKTANITPINKRRFVDMELANTLLISIIYVLPVDP